MTELLASQHSEDGAGKLSGPLRYPHTCIIWIKAEQEGREENK